MILKRNLLALALASAGICAASAAQAAAPGPYVAGQDQPQQNAGQSGQDTSAVKNDKDKKKHQATQLGVIKVSGFAASIQSAVAAKQSSNEIVEAISAEDIGKLPDVSIAESIARLPGVSAQRVAGRAQVISVRGLSPDFATTLLNGREMVSTGDNRSVEFDQYPSELVSGVTVYKTPRASLIGQGLSGTLDMHTVRPLDYQKDVTVVGVRGQHNSLGRAADSSAFGNRFNASYIGSSLITRWVSRSVTRTRRRRPRRIRSVCTSRGSRSATTGVRVYQPALTFPTASRRCAAPATPSAMV